MALVYAELRRMAGGCLRDERPDHTLQCTALVHEAWLKLVRLQEVSWQTRAQFFAISAQVMRHILVDHARARRAEKRGAGATHVSLDDALTVPAPEHLDLVGLDRAL